MNIYFYLNTEEETEIVTFYNLKRSPFRVGDEIDLTVEDLYPVEYNNYRDDFGQKLRKDNDELKEKFNLKKIKIVREGKHVSFKVLSKATLTIEYYCDIIESKA